MKTLVTAVLVVMLFGVGTLLASDAPTGTWKTVDEKSGKVRSQVEVYEQGGKLFGKITGLAEPNDQQGKPKTCTKCTGADKDQPIVGLVIIKDLSLSGDRYKGGTITDPEDGDRKSTRLNSSHGYISYAVFCLKKKKKEDK